MEIQEFSEIIKKYSEEIGIKLQEEQINKFYTYMEILLEWNEKINLTAITKPEEIILKHFIDSITISKEINENAKIIDVGTGAGFPGIPLKIIRDGWPRKVNSMASLYLCKPFVSCHFFSVLAL